MASTRGTDRGSAAGSWIRRAGDVSAGVATDGAGVAGVAWGVRTGTCVVMVVARPSRSGHQRCPGRRQAGSPCDQLQNATLRYPTARRGSAPASAEVADASAEPDLAPIAR